MSTLASDLHNITTERETIKQRLRDIRNVPGYTVLAQPPEMNELSNKLKLTEMTEKSMNSRIHEHYTKEGWQCTTDTN